MIIGIKYDSQFPDVYEYLGTFPSAEALFSSDIYTSSGYDDAFYKSDERKHMLLIDRFLFNCKTYQEFKDSKGEVLLNMRDWCGKNTISLDTYSHTDVGINGGNNFMKVWKEWLDYYDIAKHSSATYVSGKLFYHNGININTIEDIDIKKIIRDYKIDSLGMGR